MTAPYPPPAPPPPPGGPVGGQPSNTFGLVSMIVGIISIPLACCGIFGVIAGAVAIVFGFLGKQKADQGLATNRSQAMTGLICGGVGAVLGIISAIIGAAHFMNLPGM